MRITISRALYAPTWTALQEVVRQALDDEAGRFVRIARSDGKCGYRDIGVYAVEFLPSVGDMVLIHLEVTQ